MRKVASREWRLATILLSYALWCMLGRHTRGRHLASILCLLAPEDTEPRLEL